MAFEWLWLRISDLDWGPLQQNFMESRIWSVYIRLKITVRQMKTRTRQAFCRLSSRQWDRRAPEPTTLPRNSSDFQYRNSWGLWWPYRAAWWFLVDPQPSSGNPCLQPPDPLLNDHEHICSTFWGLVTLSINLPKMIRISVDFINVVPNYFSVRIIVAKMSVQVI